MRVGLLSDIHGNLQALRAVLERLRSEGVDAIACLGDVVGYGGDPEACLALIREQANVCVMGNHDAAVSWPEIRRGFHTYARDAVEAHAEWLDASDLAFLEGLPPYARLSESGGDAVFLTHGTPGERRPFTYLFSADQANPAFRSFEERFGAVGHTHVPALFERNGKGPARERSLAMSEPGEAAARQVRVGQGTRAILNPGSVGQPRDRDPRAACLVLDLRSGEARALRTPYDIAGAQAAIRRRGLPEVLADRLSVGR